MKLLKRATGISFLLLCIFGTIDIGVFMYPSLSRTLLPAIFVIVVAMLYIISVIKCNRMVVYGSCDVFFMAWTAFVFIHSLIIPPESYRLYYIVISFILVLSLSLSLRQGTINWQYVENVLLLMGVLHILYMLLQSFGLMDSGNQFFYVTGSNENPTITAIYLVGCISIVLGRIKKNAPFYMTMALVLVVAILTLRCRSAYMGLFCVIFVYAFSNGHVASMVKSLCKWRMGGIAIVLLTCAVFASYGLYHDKKESADGRFLIWKLSASMIAEHPQGYGWGLFERNYNLKQSEYFLSQDGTLSEKENADVVFMPYNDFLEMGVEGGVCGAVFLMLFYAFGIRKAYKLHDTETLSVFVAFLVMSMTNFIYSSVQPWLLLMCFAAFLSQKSVEREYKNVFLNTTAFAMGIVISVMLLFNTSKIMKCQMALAKMGSFIMQGIAVDDSKLQRLSSGIGTSELYWRMCGQNYINGNNYAKAIPCLSKAREYTSNPALFYQLFRCYKSMGKDDRGLAGIIINYGMLPHHMLPKYVLMEYYYIHHNIGMSHKFAKEILQMPVKVKSKACDMYQLEASKITQSYEK